MSSNAVKTFIIISPGFPDGEADSTCMPAQQAFVRALNKNFPHLKIYVLALHYPYRRDLYEWFGNSVIPLNGKKTPAFLRPVLWMKSYFILRAIIKHSRVCGLLSFWCQEAALIGKLTGNRYRLTHKIWIKGQDARKNNFMVRWIRPQADELVALSESLAEEFSKNHHVMPLHLVPNGIDPTLYRKSPAKRNIDIIGVGSLIPLKQFDLFVNVVKELTALHPNVKVMLIGDGPEKTKIIEQINKYGLEKNVTLKGEVAHQAVVELMQQSKILLHPSSYEGYSTVCLEALFAGCHVVSFTAAEKNTINQWHIVKDSTEMTARCHHLLTNNQVNSTVLVHTMDDSARKMMQLFTDCQK